MDARIIMAEQRYFEALKFVANLYVKDVACFTQESLSQTLEKKTLDRLSINIKSFIVSGISGVGKTLLGKSTERYGFTKIPGVTTRQPRPEESAKDYIFISEEMFWQWQEKNRFLTYCRTNEVWHALLRNHFHLLASGEGLIYIDRSVPSTIDIWKQLPPNSIDLVYLVAPSFKVLYDRIKARESNRKNRENSLTDDQILARFAEETEEFRMSLSLPYVYIVNDSIERVERILCSKRIKTSNNNNT